MIALSLNRNGARIFGDVKPNQQGDKEARKGGGETVQKLPDKLV